MIFCHKKTLELVELDIYGCDGFFEGNILEYGEYWDETIYITQKDMTIRDLYKKYEFVGFL